MSWNATWREAALPELAARDWDLIVVGGGISGAGILREAARRGWSCLLLEQRDFAWGTSSRSSKMVHGGLRYIAKGQLGLTRDSVRERQRLLGEAPGLVDALPFLFPHYRGKFPGPRVFGGLLGVYDALAGQRLHRYHLAAELRYLAPGLNDAELLGGTLFTDAVTDDARLVMRVLSCLRHGQYRPDTVIGVRKNILPMGARLAGKERREACFHARPAGRVVLRPLKVRILGQLQAGEEAGIELRLQRADRQPQAIGAGVNIVERCARIDGALALPFAQRLQIEQPMSE